MSHLYLATVCNLIFTGAYLKKCIQHLGKDECKPCPGVTWLADETNSENVHPCLHYNSCSSGKWHRQCTPISSL